MSTINSFMLNMISARFLQSSRERTSGIKTVIGVQCDLMLLWIILYIVFLYTFCGISVLNLSIYILFVN